MLARNAAGKYACRVVKSLSNPTWVSLENVVSHMEHVATVLGDCTSEQNSATCNYGMCDLDFTPLNI